MRPGTKEKPAGAETAPGKGGGTGSRAEAEVIRKKEG